MPWIPHTAEDRKEMCEAIGIRTVEDLFAKIPEELANPKIEFPPALDEQAALRHLRELSELNNLPRLSFVGAGMYEHYIPSAVDTLAGKREFATSYTPYQAEASQGMLQAIYEYQTHLARLTGLEVSNASLYDGGTAVAEGMLMAVRGTRGLNRIVVSEGIHPYWLEVLQTYSTGLGAEVVTVPLQDGVTDPDALREAVDDNTACVIVQQPNFLGCLEEMQAVSDASHQGKTLFIALVDPLSLGLLAPPGEYGADIAVGSGQPLGIPVSYGGPGVGFVCSTKKLMRQIPGRLAGGTTDTCDRRGYVLTLQAREQHIRREKATSNICTNQALCALRVAVYLSLVGKQGLIDLATDNYKRAHYVAGKLTALDGVSLAHDQPFWNEFTLTLPMNAIEFRTQLRAQGIDPGLPLQRVGMDRPNDLLMAVTETKTRDDLDVFVKAVAEVLKS